MPARQMKLTCAAVLDPGESRPWHQIIKSMLTFSWIWILHSIGPSGLNGTLDFDNVHPGFDILSACSSDLQSRAAI